MPTATPPRVSADRVCERDLKFTASVAFLNRVGAQSGRLGYARARAARLMPRGRWCAFAYDPGSGTDRCFMPPASGLHHCVATGVLFIA